MRGRTVPFLEMIIYYRTLSLIMSRAGSEETLSKQGYHLVGGGAVKPCLWLNRSLRGGDQCYKHHFYGISSHRCVQMTPTLQCNHLCLHCWRPIDGPLPLCTPLEPKEMMDGILHEQQRILSGYGGSRTTDPSRLGEARRPAHVAISLMGEPTLYPYLDELIREIRNREMTSFLVTNGTMPEVLEGLRPTQLYLSLNASDEELYRKVSNPSGNLWGRILESLSIMKDHDCRTVVRMTMVRGVNMHDPNGYAGLLKTAEPDFVEVKAYMHLGRSRLRLSRDAMPDHSEILSFSEKLADALGYDPAGDVSLSRVALLSSGRVPNKL
jgi:tRNA wybutosine-synthesizing protein 1